MKPMQKFRLLVLAVSSPVYLLLLFAVLTCCPHSLKWFAPVLGCYSVGALIFMFGYLLRHPELRPSPEERARRVADISPHKARVVTLATLVVVLAACSLYLFFARQPAPNLVRTQGFERAHASWVLTRGIAWAVIAFTFALFLRLRQVWYRQRKASLPRLQFRSATRIVTENSPFHSLTRDDKLETGGHSQNDPASARDDSQMIENP